jgi:hypothetical protein
MDSLNALRTRSVNTVSNVVQNEYFITIVTLLALAYVGSFAPKLPHSVTSMMDNVVVKFVVFYIIAYFITRKVDVALISSLAVLALVLGLQVYMADSPVKLSMESMVGGFQNKLGKREAEVTINNGQFMENEPLNDAWTQKKGEVQGYSLDWPGYEAIVNEPSEASSVESASTVSSSAEVMAMNETKDVPKNGEIVGVVGTDLSNMETL